MEAVIDTGFSLSYRDKILHFLLPLYPRPSSGDGSPHIHALTRLLITLSDPTLTIPLLTSLVPHEKLLAYQLAFDLVEGGSQDFLEALRANLPEGDEVSPFPVTYPYICSNPARTPRIHIPNLSLS
jgi:26S proteasome regulatory subunit N2